MRFFVALRAYCRKNYMKIATFSVYWCKNRWVSLDYKKRVAGRRALLNNHSFKKVMEGGITLLEKYCLLVLYSWNNKSVSASCKTFRQSGIILSFLYWWPIRVMKEGIFNPKHQRRLRVATAGNLVCQLTIRPWLVQRYVLEAEYLTLQLQVFSNTS